MKQSKFESILEAIANMIFGLAITLAFSEMLIGNLSTVCFSAIVAGGSVVKSYLIRRFFNANLHRRFIK